MARRATKIEVIRGDDGSGRSGWFVRIGTSDGDVDVIPPNHCGNPRRNTSQKRLQRFGKCAARHGGVVVPRSLRVSVGEEAVSSATSLNRQRW